MATPSRSSSATAMASSPAPPTLVTTAAATQVAGALGQRLPAALVDLGDVAGGGQLGLHEVGRPGPRPRSPRTGRTRRPGRAAPGRRARAASSRPSSRSRVSGARVVAPAAHASTLASTDAAVSACARLDVEVGDQPQRARADRRDQHALLAGGGDHRRRVGYVDHDDVRVRRVAGSTPQASASSRACAWSSASRSTWWSRACSPAAARTPTWRMPPPSRLRHTRDSAMRGGGPDDERADRCAEPLAQADREHVGASRRTSSSGVPVATWAFQIRAPSTCTPMPRSSAKRRTRLHVLERRDRAAAEVVGVLDRDRAGGHEERRPCPGRTSPRSRAARPGRPTQVRMVRPVNAAVRPELGAGDVRRGLAQHLLARRRRGSAPRARWPSTRSA